MKPQSIVTPALLVLAVMMFFVSCDKRHVETEMPFIEIGTKELSFTHQGGTQTLTLDVNRDWQAVCTSEWVAVNPSEGDRNVKEVEITLLPNDKGDAREAQVIFKTKAVYARLKVIQDPNPNMPSSIYYVNNFDLTRAEQTNGKWPYADQFEGWKGHTGSGAGTVQYHTTSISVRSNSESNGSHSLYAGSGANNLLFGSGGVLVIGKISVHPKQLSYALSFGTERYAYGETDNTFRPEEFPVMISADGKKWVTLEYTFATGGFPDGEWDLATAAFTLPQGVEELWVRFATTLTSAHRLDDVSLVASGQGQAIDWSKGQDITIPGL